MTTITIKKNGTTMHNTALPLHTNNTKLSAKSAAKPHSPRQWENLIGKRCELTLKLGHIIWADVIGFHAHTLTTNNAKIQRRDSDVIEVCSRTVHVDCQNIAIAIEQEQS
jgi:hypothetical protein